MRWLKRIVALLLSVLIAAVTANGYRPLTKRGFPSLYAFGFGVFASELPLQIAAGHAAAFLPVSRGLGGVPVCSPGCCQGRPGWDWPGCTGPAAPPIPR